MLSFVPRSGYLLYFDMRYWLLIILFLACGMLWWNWEGIFPPKLSGIALLKQHYAAEIEQLSKEMDLPADFFKALVILECGGERPAPTRYEPHVFKRLKDVRDGKSPRYGRFQAKQLRLMTESTLQKLATSWGPLQILGYHCLPLGITLDQLRGDEALRYGMLWADKQYGDYLRRGDYVNAFHIHNTGQPLPADGIPRTHHPDYILRGMEYLKYFRTERRKARANGG